MDDAATDQQLLERIGSGDTSAFWEAWERHAVYVSQICRQTGGDEDDVHDIMLKLASKLPKHAANISNLRAWMGKTAQNFCIDRHRSADRRMDFVSVDDVELADPKTARRECSWEMRQLDQGLAQLSAQVRETVHLRFVQGLSYREISERLRVPEACIRKRIERARKILRREIGDRSRKPAAGARAGKSLAEEPREVPYSCSFLRLVPVALEGGIDIDVPVAVAGKRRRPRPDRHKANHDIVDRPLGLREHERLAQFFHDTGAWREAVEEYRRILRSQPHRIDAWLQLGDLLLRLGRGEEAAQAFFQAHYVARRPATRCYIQGMILICRRDYDAALDQFERAAAFEPEHAGIQWAVLTSLATSGRLGAVIDVGREMLRMNPCDANARLACCHALARTGCMEEAAQHAEECLKSDPENFLALNYLAGLRCAKQLVRSEEGKATLRMIKTMLRLSPGAADAHEVLARFYLARGQYAKGLCVLRRFVNGHPQKPMGWFYYALWLFHATDVSAAETALAKARALWPAGAAPWEQACRAAFDERDSGDVLNHLFQARYSSFPREWNRWPEADEGFLPARGMAPASIVPPSAALARCV